MKIFNKTVFSAAASFLLCVAVHANQAPCAPMAKTSKVAAVNAVYEGRDSRGRIVQLTIRDPQAETFTKVATPHRNHPRLDWTARIGSGAAAAAERGDLIGIAPVSSVIKAISG